VRTPGCCNPVAVTFARLLEGGGLPWRGRVTPESTATPSPLHFGEMSDYICILTHLT
jgi:hypothetical protein